MKENGQWKIAQFSNAPVEILSSNGYGFGTVDEKQASDILKRYENEGKLLNHKGKL